MKIILPAFFLAVAPLVLAQGADTNMPPELAALRARYQDGMASLKKRYLQELQQLEANAVATNNPVLATAVSQEITSMGGTDTTVGQLDDSTDSPIEDIKAKLVNTTWAWNGGETFILLPNGKAKWSGADAPTMTWKVVGSSPPVVTGIAHNGAKYRMTLDDDLRSGKLFEGTASVRITARIDPKQP